MTKKQLQKIAKQVAKDKDLEGEIRRTLKELKPLLYEVAELKLYLSLLEKELK